MFHGVDFATFPTHRPHRASLWAWIVVGWLTAFVTNSAVAQSTVPETESATSELFPPPSSNRDEVIAQLTDRLAEVELKLQQREAKDLQAADKAKQKFVVRPFGRVHIDSGTFNQDDANKASVGADAHNGVSIRRARLGVEGEGFDRFFYRFDVDFVTFDQSTATRPTIFDAYLDVQKFPVLGNLRVGHFREPFSLERLDSSNDQPFLERSAAINTLAPFRNVGLMAFDWNADETMTWSYGVFDEATNEFGEDNRDRTGLAGTGRVTWLPFVNEDNSRLIHVGASYSYRKLGNTERKFAARPELFLKEGALSTPSFVDTGPLQIHDYHVAGLEMSSVLGPLSFQGEYVALAGVQTDGNSLFLQGGYLEAMYWLTGEHREFNRTQGRYGSVTPKHAFRNGNQCDCGGGFWGAWELTGRVSWFDIDHGSLHGGRLTNLTCGLNWNYAVRSRVMLNYIHSFLDRNSVNSNADIFAVRLQYVF